jgi:hypothetical protein
MTIEMRTAFLGIPVKNEVIRDTRVVETWGKDPREGGYGVHKLVVIPDKKIIQEEHYSSESLSGNLCHISLEGRNEIRLYGRDIRLFGRSVVKRTLVRK